MLIPIFSLSPYYALRRKLIPYSTPGPSINLNNILKSYLMFILIKHRIRLSQSYPMLDTQPHPYPQLHPHSSSILIPISNPIPRPIPTSDIILSRIPSAMSEQVKSYIMSILSLLPSPISSLSLDLIAVFSPHP